MAEGLISDFVEENTATTGNGLTLTLTAKTGFARFSDVWAAGTSVRYTIRNGNNAEHGIGTVQAGNTLDRTTPVVTLVAGVYDNTSPVRITLSGSSVVSCAPSADYLAYVASPTFTAVTLTDGQVVFPATQVPSANANTLDDYEKGTWTPVITFTTPGDLSVTHSTQIGNYVKIGDAIDISCEIQTSVFTHTTASGELVVNGVPFTSGYTVESTLQFQGITKASYTQFALQWTAATASLRGRASGSGQTLVAFTAADMPTGGTVRLFAALSSSV